MRLRFRGFDWVERFFNLFDNGINFSRYVKNLKSKPGPRKISTSADSISDRGLDFIRKHEGLRLTAYMPTPNDVPTIGYGHTKGVKMGDRITEEQAVEFLRQDIAWVEEAIDRYVTVQLNQNQYDALASWVFNLGARNFLKSTMLRRINEGSFAAVPGEMARWNKQKGKVLAGLTKRRAEEGRLWSTPV